MGRKRTAVVGIGLLLLPAACGDDGGGSGDGTALPTATADAGDDSTTSITAADDTSTSTTATTTFAQADDPPDLVNTGEDFDAIVRSFVAYGEWVSVHPDLGRLDDVFRRGAPEWLKLEPIFSQLIADGLHTNGGTPGAVQEVRVLERPGDDLVIVYVVIDSPAFQIVDQSGGVVEERPAAPRTSWAYELRREGGGPWLIENRTVLGAVE